jgi:hypothetical protein
MRPFIPAILLAATLSIPAWAQMMPPEPDQVVLELNAEEWAETETATVRIGVDAAFQGTQNAAVRDEVLKALARTSPETKWYLTRFDQVADPSGLERWRVAAEARMGEAKLAGLRQRAEQASRPGLKVNVVAIDFTPTLAEREAQYGKLRARIYEQVKEEVASLNKLYPDRKYRVRRIDVGNGTAQPMFRAQETLSRAPAPAAAQAADAMSVSEKLRVRASVILATE